MIRRILFATGLVLLLLGSLFGYKFHQINQTISQIKPPPPPVIAVAEVKQQSWSSSLSTIGNITAMAGVSVSNEVAGKITALHFESGQSVKAGQLLIDLDTATDEAELKGLQAEQQLAQIRYQRNAQMLDKHFVSRSDYDQSKATLEQTTAAVNAKQTLIAKKHIRAPFAGELAIRQVNLGQYLAPGSAIVDLQALTPIYVDFSIPERQLAQLSNGQKIQLTVQAFAEQLFAGEIIAISPEIDSNSRTLKVRALLPNADKRLRPGMFAQVQIDSGSALSVLTIPDTAISYNPYGNSVFLLQHAEQGFTVQNRQIQTGQTREGRVEILSGLQAGDRVVSAGQLKLRNGMPVTIDAQPAPGER